MDETSTTAVDAPADPARVLSAIAEHIGVRPGFCGGRPHILGHRIKLKHVAIWHEEQGLSPAQIVEQYPTITLAQVHAALSCFYDHRAEIETEVAEEERIYQDLKAKQPSILEKIRLRKGHASDDPVPPG